MKCRLKFVAGEFLEQVRSVGIQSKRIVLTSVWKELCVDFLEEILLHYASRTLLEYEENEDCLLAIVS